MSKKHIVAVIEGHSKFESTDRLYDPLRQAFCDDTTVRAELLQQAGCVSKVTHFAKPQTYIQNLSLGKGTLIRDNVKLKPTGDLWKVRTDRPYYIVDAKKKELEPITEQELRARLVKVPEAIVYDYGTQCQSEDEDRIKEAKQSTGYRWTGSTVHYASPQLQNQPLEPRVTYVEQQQPRPLNFQPARTDTNQSQRQTVRTQQQSGRGLQRVRSLSKTSSSRRSVRQQPARPGYNFFSVIDEPVNNFFKKPHLASCVCPKVHLVEEPISEITWYQRRRI